MTSTWPELTNGEEIIEGEFPLRNGFSSSELLKFTQIWWALSYHEQSKAQSNSLKKSGSPIGMENLPVVHRGFIDLRCWFWFLPSPFWCHSLSVGCRALSRGESQGAACFFLVLGCCLSCNSRSCTYCKKNILKIYKNINLCTYSRSYIYRYNSYAYKHIKLQSYIFIGKLHLPCPLQSYVATIGSIADEVSKVIRLVILGEALPVYAVVGAGGLWLHGSKVSANVLQEMGGWWWGFEGFWF